MLAHLQKHFGAGGGNPLFRKKLLCAEQAFAGNQLPQPAFRLLVQARLGADSLKILHLPDADLEIFQSCGKKGFHHHGNHFPVRLGAVITHQLRSHLSDLFQLSLKAACVCEGVSRIAEADGNILIHIVFGGAPGHGGGKIRPQYQGISLLVKKLVQLSGRSRSDFPGENVKKFKGGSLDVLIPIQIQGPVYGFLHMKLPGIFPAVNVPYAFRCM